MQTAKTRISMNVYRAPDGAGKNGFLEAGQTIQVDETKTQNNGYIYTTSPIKGWVREANLVITSVPPPPPDYTPKRVVMIVITYDDGTKTTVYPPGPVG